MRNFCFNLPVSESDVNERLKVITHRGPDHSDYFISDGVALGHNRLAIVDLDERANQPFHYGGLSIVFNGEIYNHLKSRKGSKLRVTNSVLLIPKC